MLFSIYWYLPYHFHYGEDDHFHIVLNDDEEITYARCGVRLEQMHGKATQVAWPDICFICAFNYGACLYNAQKELN